MKHYLQTRLPEWIIEAVISTSVIFAVCSGFVLTDPLSASVPVTACFVLLLGAVILLLGYRRWSLLAGGFLGMLLLGAAAAYAHAARPWEDESANSIFLYVVILFLTVILISALGKSRVGAAALFLIGSTVIAGAHFLQFPIQIWTTFLFVAASAMLFFYRCYMSSVLKAQIGQVSIGRYVTQSMAFCLAALLIAFGLYFGVVRPLNPPTQELKLITQLQSMEMLKVLGVSSVHPVLDPTLNSEADPNRTEEDRADEESRQDESDDLTAPPETAPEEAPPEEVNQPEETETNAEATAIRYQLPTSHVVLIAALTLIFLLVLAFLLRLFLRLRWHKRVQMLAPESAVINYYSFFARRLSKIGLGRYDGNTLREYARESETALSVFSVGDVDFAHLSMIYEGVIYGAHQVTEEELGMFEQFYSNFLKNLRKEIGTFRYCMQLFRF